MRILHVTDVYKPAVGGIEIFVEGLAERQAAAGHDVVVLTTAGSRTPDPEGQVRVVRTGYRPVPVDVREFDVVHGHLSVLSPLATLVARSASSYGVATVLSVHTMWSDRLPVVRTVGALAGWRESRAVWAAVSGAAAADVRKALPFARVEVVPNAVDVAWWRDVRREVTDEVTLLSVMRLSDRKRPQQLLRMLRDVRRETPDVPLRAVIVGSGPLESALSRWIRWHGLGDWVSMVGVRNATEIRELCARSDVYVAPATRESFGIAALEARSAGLPVVAMRSGGVREFVTDGVEGLLCADDADMTRALTELVTDDRLRQRMRAYNTVVPPAADWVNALQRFAAVYSLAESQSVGGRERVAT